MKMQIRGQIAQNGLAILLQALAAFLTINEAVALDCPQQNYVLTTQAEVDAFPIECDSILGNLEVDGSQDVTDLTALMNISSVGGNVYVLGNIALTNLDGLVNLSNIGGDLRIGGNVSLTNIDGLVNLVQIGHDLYFSDNDLVKNIDGLSNLSTIGNDVVIQATESLTNLNGLSGLSAIPGDLYIGSGNLPYAANESLVDLNGLANLVTIGGRLNVSNNTNLLSLTGLHNVASVGELNVAYNIGLLNCNSIAFLLGWPDGPPDDSVDGDISLGANGGGGCNSISGVIDGVAFPSEPVITGVNEGNGKITFEFVESTPSDEIFPIQGYGAYCEGAMVDAQDSPETLLPDHTPVDFTLDISGFDPSYVAPEIKMSIDLSHPRPEQIVMALKSPGDVIVELWNQDGAGTFDIVGVFPENLVPQGSFNQFSEGQMDGTWTLSVEDIVIGPIVREGVLNSWGLQISEIVRAESLGSPLSLASLVNDRDYVCTVAPLTKLGAQPESAPVFVSPVAEIPSQPLVYATDVLENAIVLYVNWQSDGGSPISLIDAECSDGLEIFTASSSDTPITVSGLVSGVGYTCTVTVSNSVGTSQSSTAIGPIAPGDQGSGRLPIWILIKAMENARS